NPWARGYMIGRERSGFAPFVVDWVYGACLMARRSAVELVGSLDEGFFMYWEDADWCHRMKDAGFTVHCVPDARVVHYEGQRERRSAGAVRKRAGRSPRGVAMFHRSAYRYVAKHVA